MMQASVLAEMWVDFKFAINPFNGDSKPNPAVTAEKNALSRASSKFMSKVSSTNNAEIETILIFLTANADRRP